MLKLDLILQIMNQIDYCQEEKIKVIGLMKNELSKKIVTKFVGLRAKIYSYLIDNSTEDKKVKSTKKFLIKKNLNLKIIKSCLEATQLDNKIKYLEKNKINIGSVKENLNEFIETINQY